MEITKKVYEKLATSIKILKNDLKGTIFIDLKKSKTPDPNRLVLNREHRMNVKRDDYVIYSTWKKK